MKAEYLPGGVMLQVPLYATGGAAYTWRSITRSVLQALHGALTAAVARRASFHACGGHAQDLVRTLPAVPRVR